MTLEQKIYVAKSSWDISFERLACLFDMDKTEIIRIYHQEEENMRKMHTIALRTAPWDCLRFTERTKNILKRRGIKTVRQLIKLKTPQDVAWRGVGTATSAEILAAADRARKEIESDDSTRASSDVR